MMSLEAIVYLNNQVAVQAEERELVPYTPESIDEIDSYPPFPFPNLGYFQPDGWEEDEETHWFVDKSGFGNDWEPAMTLEQFKKVLRKYHREHTEAGFAIVEEGQFQVYISAFLPLQEEVKS